MEQDYVIKGMEPDSDTLNAITTDDSLKPVAKEVFKLLSEREVEICPCKDKRLENIICALLSKFYDKIERLRASTIYDEGEAIAASAKLVKLISKAVNQEQSQEQPQKQQEERQEKKEQEADLDDIFDESDNFEDDALGSNFEDDAIEELELFDLAQNANVSDKSANSDNHSGTIDFSSIIQEFDSLSDEIGELIENQDNKQIIMMLGAGKGRLGHALDAKALIKIYEKRKQNKQIRQILSYLGRLVVSMKDFRQKRTQHGYDDMVNIGIGPRFRDVVTSELTYLADDVIELDLLRRYAEGQLLVKEYQEQQPTKGPVVVVLDESYSMVTTIAKAKAIALAFAMIAKEEKRQCFLISYSDCTGEKFINVNNTTADEIFNWLSDFIGGGSTLDIPIHKLPTWFKEHNMKKADIVIVSDGYIRPSPEQVDNFVKWKQTTNIKTVGICTAVDTIMKEFCDDIIKTSDLELSDDDKRAIFNI
ncbi:MAG: hypothetical protein KatS3mg087_1158 [Patescibacteria group bacterium]|nr:MAG: hypothetical protein KatS3mg087_1158 [Patescibacteria group bacterium]